MPSVDAIVTDIQRRFENQIIDVGYLFTVGVECPFDTNRSLLF